MKLLALVVTLSTGCDALFGLDHIEPSDSRLADASDPGFGAWSVPVPLAELNSTGTDSQPSMTADQLSIYFSSDRTGSFEVYRSVRATRTDAFGLPSLVAELNVESVLSGQVSGNGQAFYFSRYYATNDSTDIYQMARASDASPFASPSHLAAISSAADDFNAAVADGELTAIITRSTTVFNDQSMYLYERATATSSWSERKLDELETPDLDSAAHIAPDGLTLVFYSDRLTENLGDLYMATRPAPETRFAPPQLLESLSTPSAHEADPYLSPDLSTIVFRRDDDLWISIRPRS